MTDQPLKTRPDGSIDADYYMRRGRRLRSEAAHAMIAGPRPVPTANAPAWLGRLFGAAPRKSPT